jgi:hypothetical protein
MAVLPFLAALARTAFGLSVEKPALLGVLAGEPVMDTAECEDAGEVRQDPGSHQRLRDGDLALAHPGYRDGDDALQGVRRGMDGLSSRI